MAVGVKVTHGSPRFHVESERVDDVASANVAVLAAEPIPTADAPADRGVERVTVEEVHERAEIVWVEYGVIVQYLHVLGIGLTK